MSLFGIETCLWMHTMFDWNRDKTADLAELSHQLWWYDADLSLFQLGDLLWLIEH